MAVEAEYLTVAGVAQFCSLHENTIRKAIHAGELKSLRAGKTYRIRKTAVHEWMEAMNEQWERSLRSA